MTLRKTFARTLLIASLAFNVQAGDDLSDETIMAIFDQANTVDIWIGRVGLMKGHSPEVKQLAQMVVTDHQVVQQMGRDLAKAEAIVPAPPINDQSAKDLADTIKLLQSKEGKAFDEAYLKREITFHQNVIDAINNTLLPSIENPKFKELLLKVLPGFKHHLKATRDAAKKLGVTE